jgi:hypothetical protein
MSLNAEPMSVFAADLDGSGFDDVIGAIRVAADGVPDRISWFRDPGTLPAEVPEFDISTQLEGPRAVYAVDLNADGLIDVLSASTNDNKITLFVNDGLDSSETPPRPVFVEVPISTNALGAMWVTAADLFGDCNSAEPAPCLEVLSASSRDNKIAWYQITTEAPPAATAIVPSAGTPSLSVTPDPLDFGNVFVGRIDTESLEPAPKMLPVTIENGGVDPLVITSITSTAPQFTPSVTDLTVPAGMSGEIGVGFLPSSGATFSGTLEFTVDGATEPAAGIDMSGVGLTFVENVLTTSAFFARYVSTGDVDGNGLTDVLSASSGDRRITAWLQQDTDPVTFRDLVIEDNANNARSAMVANLDQDPAGSADVVTAHYFTIRWHEGGIEERCNDFDVDGDERMAGAELSWIWLAFTQSGDPQGGTEWWRPVDYNKDGIIDGDDVAIAAGAGVWTRFVNPTSGDPAGPVCNYSCISQD